MNKIIKCAAVGLCSIFLGTILSQPIPAITFSQYNSYTIAKIHPKKLSVYVQPNKNSTIYTTVYQNQQIECVNYENDWLTLAFQDGFFGFIDAYQAELKTYYDYSQQTSTYQQIVYEFQQDNYINQSYQPIVNYEQNQDNYELIKSVEYIETEQQEYNEYEYSQQQEQILNTFSDELINQQQQIVDYNEQLSQQTIDQNNYYQQKEEQQIIEEQNFIDDQIYYEQYEEQQIEINVQNGNNDIVDYADQYIGNPYSYGGNSLTDGIDCSHFVWQVLTNTGHYSGGYAVSDDWANLGQGVNSLDEAVAGDVIVYSGHVAIYDGEGGIVEAKGQEYGITHDRSANHGDIIAIRHFD